MNKNGKIPASKKGQVTLNPDSVFSNKLIIPEKIKKDLEERGLEARFVDAKKLYENNGYHERDWVPYVMPPDMRTTEFKFGNDPDGVFRRGTLLLAVKSKEDAAKHREFLRLRAERLNVTNHQKEEADKMRQWAKETRGGVKVLEGYEEND